MNSSRNNAFTLIELMLTLAIVSLLTLAALKVAAATSRDVRSLQKAADAPGLAPGLMELISRDLMHAHKLRKTASGFALQTHVCLDPKTFELRHMPAEVEYEVRKVGQRSLLVRRQRLQDQKETRELVCCNVSAIGIQSAPNGAAGGDDWQPATEAVTVSAVLGTTGMEPQEMVFTVRKR